jgi:hypothetical protein
MDWILDEFGQKLLIQNSMDGSQLEGFEGPERGEVIVHVREVAMHEMNWSLYCLLDSHPLLEQIAD